MLFVLPGYILLLKKKKMVYRITEKEKSERKNRLLDNKEFLKTFRKPYVYDRKDYFKRYCLINKEKRIAVSRAYRLFIKSGFTNN